MTTLPSLFALIRMTFATLRQRCVPVLALSSLAMIASILIGQAALALPLRWTEWTNTVAIAILVVVQIVWQGGLIALLHSSERIGIIAALRRAVQHLRQLCVAAAVTWAIAGLPLAGVLVADLAYAPNANHWTVADSALAVTLLAALLWFIAAAAALLFAPFRIMVNRERGLVALLHSFTCIRGTWAGLALRLVSFFLLLMAAVLLLDYVPSVGALLIGLAVTPLLTIFSFHLFTVTCKHRNPAS